MKYATVFDFITTEFKKAGIDFVLIGGYAVNAHHVDRNTRDIDFMIAEEDYKKMHLVMTKEGYEEFDRSKTYSRWTENEKYLRILDFVFTDRPTLDKLIQYGEEKKLAGCRIKVPSVEQLISMKLHAIKQQPERRVWKDWIDIIQLIKVHRINVRTDKFKQMCLHYGTADLYRRILEHETKTEKKDKKR